MPSGRGALVERIRKMLEGGDALEPRIVAPEQVAAADLRSRHGSRALRIEARSGPDGKTRLLAVLDLDAQAIAAEAERLQALDAATPVEIVDRTSWLALRRLMQAGVVAMAGGHGRVLHVDPDFADDETPSAGVAAARREEADRTVRMAGALAAGGFPEEAGPLLAKALRSLVAARREAGGERAPDDSLVDPGELRTVARAKGLSRELEIALAAVPSGAKGAGAAPASDAANAAARLIESLWPVEAASGATPDLSPRALVA